jgi:hypothetical protein
MNRGHLSEQIQRIRRDENRDPLERAFHAVAALTKEERAALVAHLNQAFNRCTPPQHFSYQIGGAA